MALSAVESLFEEVRNFAKLADSQLATSKDRKVLVANHLPPKSATAQTLLKAVPGQRPRESLATAQAALRLALDLKDHLVLEAILEVANASRRCGDFGRAAKALDLTERLQVVTVIEPMATARYFSVLGSLRNVQRQYDEAIAATVHARGIYEDFGAVQLSARELVKEAFIHTDHDRLDLAVKVGDQALRRARSLGDRKLMRIAHGNLCAALIELRLMIPAEDMMHKWEKLYSASASSNEVIRWRWKLARLKRVRGQAMDAVPILSEVCDALAQEGYGWEYVVARLDFALCHLEVGNTNVTLATCSELAGICEGMGAPLPKLAAISLADTALAMRIVLAKRG